MLPETERAYLAGILDGEGCVSVMRRGKYLTPTVQVTNTKRVLLEWLLTRYGGRIYEKAEARPTRKTCWLWSVAGQKAMQVMRDARPYLLLKAGNVDLIRCLPRFSGFGTRDSKGRVKGTMTPADFEANEQLVLLIRELNQRGVVQEAA